MDNTISSLIDRLEALEEYIKQLEAQIGMV